MTTPVKRLALLLLSYFSAMPLIFGWVAGLICHRIHDGWTLSRRMLGQLDDAVIEELRALKEKE